VPTHGCERSASDHLAVEVGGVVGAQQVEAVGGGERLVEQRLVALALDELVGRAAGPDRLADAAQRAAAPGHEIVPGRDDAGRVVADVAHVGPLDAVGVTAEPPLQRAQLGGLERDHDRLAAGHPVLDERGDAVEERLGTCVEDGFMTEGVGREHLSAKPSRPDACGKLRQCGGSGF
jgi:hypothetical protein